MNLATHIRNTDYLRERLTPAPGERNYLHLSDLRLALEKIKTEKPIAILDYGCGGSPYKTLFPNAVYKRADFLNADMDPVDYVLKEDSMIEERDGFFDLIVSTQVLEHVSNPRTYLAECHRLLKPGGQLYLTTHGSYPDHACPDDFWRWTADGLAKAVRVAGFSSIELEKHTTGPRAFFQELDIHLYALRAPHSTCFGVMLGITRKMYARFRPWFHRMCDRHFPKSRVVRENLEAHAVYLVVGCAARK
jgi:SAM-dependent methyltransferase